MIKSKIRSLINKLGFNLTRYIPTPYDSLLGSDRFKQKVIMLCGHDFTIADSLSFHGNYREIFIDQIYNFSSESSRPTILDCGSNYGTSIVYFKSIYPQSKIIGVEADPDIYHILNENIAIRKYEDVTLINKALSTSKAPVCFYSEGADGGRIFTNQNAKNIHQVNTIDLDDLINEPIDFLKMDIEGAESEVIPSSRKLGSVRNLFIEYHSFTKSTQELDRVLGKLTSEGFRYYIHTQFCSDRPLIEEKLNIGMDLQLNIFAKNTKK